MSKIAVTGADGFIGRHVMNVLRATEHDVVAISRTPGALDYVGERVSIVSGDLEALSGGGYDAIGRPDVLIHLAWGGLPNYESLHHFERELPLQYKFLRAMISGGLGSVVVAGTCFEYGMQSGQLAETTVCAPTTAYALAKHTLHRELELLRREISFELTWARIFYTYGPGQAASSLWTQLNAALVRGDEQFNMSGGEQLRDFLPVEQVARSLGALAVIGGDVGAVNVCSGYPKSVRSLVEQWLAQSGKQIRLNLGQYPYPAHEPMAFWGANDKLRAVLGHQ